MGNKTLFTQLNSTKSDVEIIEGIKRAFQPLGGMVQIRSTGLEIEQGKNEVRFGSTANMTASVSVQPVNQTQYEIQCAINWSPNTLVWICLIVGVFVLGILWIVPLFYLFVDPTSAYQQALNRIQTYAGDLSVGTVSALPVSPGTQKEALAKQLEEAKQMMEDGFLTEEEYKKLKQKILHT